MPNGLKTALLLGLLSGLLLAIGQLLGGANGMLIGFIFAVVMNFGSYWFSDKIVLRMYHAQEVGPGHRLFGMVERLSRQASLPMPKVYIIPDPSPNAFATGRNPEHASVAVTRGILQILDERELRGVLAHELSHVANRDILISSIAAAIGMSITFLARFAFFFGGNDERGGGGLSLLLAWILAPIAAMLIQMAVTRSREFQADESGAFLSKDPDALASALLKLEQASRQVPPLATLSPAEAHLFIVNPMNALQARGMGGISSLFRTHPPTEDRVERLRAIASELRGERGPIG